MIRDPSEKHNDIARMAQGLRRYARAVIARDSEDPRRDADDLARETIERAERGGGAPNPRIWLYATLTTLNRVRARAFASRPSRPTSGQGVTDALGAMPLDQREALALIVVEGFNYAEATDILGVTRAAVAARVARARASLEQTLLAARPVDSRGGRPRSTPHLRLIK